MIKYENITLSEHHKVVFEKYKLNELQVVGCPPSGKNHAWHTVRVLNGTAIYLLDRSKKPNFILKIYTYNAFNQVKERAKI